MNELILNQSQPKWSREMAATIESGSVQGFCLLPVTKFTEYCLD